MLLKGTNTHAAEHRASKSEPHFYSGLVGSQRLSYLHHTHPCTRGIKLGYDVLRTPAFLRIENYIFHKSDFFQRRDRLFSYPRGIIPTPTPTPLLALCAQGGVVWLPGVKAPCWEIGRLLGPGVCVRVILNDILNDCIFLHARRYHKMCKKSSSISDYI